MSINMIVIKDIIIFSHESFKSQQALYFYCIKFVIKHVSSNESFITR